MTDGGISSLFGQPDDWFRLLEFSESIVTLAPATVRQLVAFDSERIFLGIYLTDPFAGPTFSTRNPIPATGGFFLNGPSLGEYNARSHPGFVQQAIFALSGAGGDVSVIQVFDRSSQRATRSGGARERVQLADALRRVRACTSKTISRSR